MSSVEIKRELIDRISFVILEMKAIETNAQNGLTIHQMADLERYANTLDLLGSTYDHLRHC